MRTLVKAFGTVGPASDPRPVLEQLMRMGMQVRTNMAHGSHDEHRDRIYLVRQISSELGIPVAILVDLAGIKLRLGEIIDNLHLSPGESVVVSAVEASSDAGVLPFPYPSIIANFVLGSKIIIADGEIELEVITTGEQVTAKLLSTKDVVISSRKGVNVPGTQINLRLPTEQDTLDLEFLASLGEDGPDWLGLSFVRTAEDVKRIKYAAERAYGPDCDHMPLLMAKIERAQAVENMDEILREVDGAMLAQGDLYVEVESWKIPNIGHQLLERTRKQDKVCMFATGLLGSMEFKESPDRAEIGHVASVVEQGVDAILFSNEISMGINPVKALDTGMKIIEETERRMELFQRHDVNGSLTRSIAQSASDLAKANNAKILVLTTSGKAAFVVSQFRTGKVLVVAHTEGVLRKTGGMGWGLHPAGVIPRESTADMLLYSAVTTCLEQKLIGLDDMVVMVYGWTPGVSGSTSSLHCVKVRDFLKESRFIQFKEEELIPVSS